LSYTWYTSGLNATLEVKKQWLPQPACQYNNFMMELAEQYNFTCDQKWQINLCQVK
jgi:hypothetical protein